MTLCCKCISVHLRRAQAQLTELDGEKLARGAEEGARQVLRSEAEAQTAAERVAVAVLAVKAVSRKVPSFKPVGRRSFVHSFHKSRRTPTIRLTPLCGRHCVTQQCP